MNDAIEPTAEVKPVSNAFTRLLAMHRDGDTAHEASVALRECLEAIEATGKPGKVILELTFSPASKGKHLAVAVEAEVKGRPPKPEKEASLFFVDGEHNLTRDNPQQFSLPLKTVETPAAPLKEVAAS